MVIGKAVSQWSFCSIAVSTDNLAFGHAGDCVRLGLVVSHRRNKRVVSAVPQGYSTTAKVIVRCMSRFRG
jgi:hypothetical protein